MRKLLPLFVLLAVVTGCVRKEPEGPAEQIGKGIDQLSKGVRQLERENAAGDSSAARDRGIRDSRTRDPRLDTDEGPTPDEWETYEEWQRRKGYR